MEGYGCGIDVSSVNKVMESHLLLVELSCLMLHGAFLLANFWSLAFRIMLLLIVLQAVAILYKGTAFVFMGTTFHRVYAPYSDLIFGFMDKIKRYSLWNI